VTTFELVVASKRTCFTEPVKVFSGNASTVNSTFIPGASWPTSDSATLVWTSMSRRSPASTNRTGACSDAATVWPTSMLREITTPSIGEVIVV